MLDIDWSKVPEGYDWAAQDKCGYTYVYRERPFIVEKHGIWAADGRCEHVEVLKKNRSWKNSLTHRSEK